MKMRKKGSRTVHFEMSPSKRMESNTPVSFNGGYLFLQTIYYALGLDSIAKKNR